MERYLLYRPEFGIAHTFRILELCLKYCEKYNRKLIIDNEYKSWFVEPFNKYMVFHNECFYTGPKLDLDSMV